MKFPYRIAIALVIMGIITAAFVRSGPREPRYQGRSLTSWLEKRYLHKGEKKPFEDYELAGEALREIGTNAIPVLCSMMREKDSTLKTLALRCVTNLTLIKLHFKTASEVRFLALCAYRGLRPYTKEHLPIMLVMLTDKDFPGTRAEAAENLGAIGLEAVEAVPALIKASKDKDARVRHRALVSLSQILVKPELVVPILSEALNDASDSIREDMALRLAAFGPQAKAAIPALQRALKVHTNDAVNLELAIQEIAPEAAPKVIVP